jgi:hypothetical protein
VQAEVGGDALAKTGDRVLLCKAVHASVEEHIALSVSDEKSWNLDGVAGSGRLIRKEE